MSGVKKEKGQAFRIQASVDFADPAAHHINASARYTRNFLISSSFFEVKVILVP